MSPLSKQEQGLKILVILASLVLLIAGLKAAADFFVPLLLAFFIATVSFPITNWLREHKVPRFFAVLITVLVDFLFLAAIVVSAISLLGDLQTKWEIKYQKLSEQRVDDVEVWAANRLKSVGWIEWEEGMTVSLLLQRLNFTFPLIIVSVDGVMVHKQDYASFSLPPDADVRVIHMTAGG